MRTYKKWNESTVQLTLPPSIQSQWGWDELLTVIDAILLPYIHIWIWTIEQSLGVVSIHHMHNIGSSMCNLIEVDKLFLLLILKCIHMRCPVTCVILIPDLSLMLSASLVLVAKYLNHLLKKNQSAKERWQEMSGRPSMTKAKCVGGG